MNNTMDDTLNPALESWVPSANSATCDFPIQNLPFGRFRTQADAPWRIGVAIGDCVLDVRAAKLIDHSDMQRLMQSTVTELHALRQALSNGLAQGSRQQAAWEAALLPQSEVELGLPCEIGDYTDFYAGAYHATEVGRQFRPDNPLLPNYQWVPIGYHGRTSTLLASGAAFHRPHGQIKPAGADVPRLAASQRLDLELELGLLLGWPNALGQPIALQQAEQHLFGITLLNDWSARDIQAWEYQPLGPFLAKNFASSLSPWVVTLHALAPFRRPLHRPEGFAQPLPYLDTPDNRSSGAFDIHMEVLLQTARMAQAGHAGDVISRSNFAEAACWTAAQLITHHSINGCALRTGDLLGTGTLSGSNREHSSGSLLELTHGGSQPLQLSNGEHRGFLEDGDTIVLRAWCQREGARRIGFGECRGTVLPAQALSGEHN